MPDRMFTIGENATVTVGVNGPVTAVGDGTVTIGGVTMPTRLVPGVVRYMSTEIPDGDWDPDDGPCLYCVENQSRADEVAEGVAVVIRAEHDEHHDGPQRFCRHPTCDYLNRKAHT